MRIKVKAPATIANFGPGFDVFGMCINGPHDVIEVEANPAVNPSKFPAISISCKRKPGSPTLPWKKDPSENTAGRAAREVIDRFLSKYQDDESKVQRIKQVEFKIKILKGIRAGSGIGSSAASAAGAAVAMHYLLRELTGGWLDRVSLAECAAAGEGAASGIHPDNTTPAVFGGFTVSFAPEIKYGNVPWEKRQYDMFRGALSRYVKMGFGRFVPPKMFFSIVFQDIVLETRVMRQLLVNLKPKDADFNGNVETVKRVVAGFEGGDFEAIFRDPEKSREKKENVYGLEDKIVTPARKVKIDYFDGMEGAAGAAGAKAFIICGSGPCVAAVSENRHDAENILKAMRDACKNDILMSFVAEPNPKGVEVIGSDFELNERTGAELYRALDTNI